MVEKLCIGGFNMNQLTIIQKTMSTLEISGLTLKQHQHVKRDFENMCAQLQIDASTFGRTYLDSMNRKQTEYLLDQETTLCLVSGYSAPLRMAIIKRWKELESQALRPQLPDFTNPVEAARAWANEVEAKQIAQEQLAIAAPKVEYFDKVAERATLLNATQVGQKVGMSAIIMNRHLDEFKVYNKGIKRSRVFQQWFIDQGFGELKQTETGHSQAMFTIKGEQWIIEKFISEGLI